MKPVTNFYYSKTLPDNAVALAKVTSTPITPAAYIDKLNALPASGQIGPGDLGAKAWPVEAHYFPPAGLAKSLAVNNNQPVTGQSYEYTVENQFLEITDTWDQNGDYFYFHHLPNGISQISILDNQKQALSVPFLLRGSRLFHSLGNDGGLYWVRYYSENVYHEEVLTSFPVMSRRTVDRHTGDAPFTPAGTFGWTHGVVDLPSRDEHRLRFYEDNRYRVLDPYITLPNDPWYVRVRFNVKPMPAEWARMLFYPYRPYMPATWVPGKLVAPGVIEFERTRMLWNGTKYPDVLVFDKNYQIKYALDGNPVEELEKLGYVYPWSRSRFMQIDPLRGRVRVNVEIEPDDIIYGFYFYEELDLIYTSLDINPFTNPLARNTVIEFYYEGAASQERSIYHIVRDHNGNVVDAASNPPANTNNFIGKLVVGGSVSLSEFTVEDVRVRGGGLADEYVNLPETRNLWDLGYWDGKPYPVKGGLVVYLPEAILSKFSEDFISSTVQATVPMGTVPVLRIYSSDGEER